MPVSPIPEGFRTLTPLLSVKGAGRMIDFLKAAFGAEERSRFTMPDGTLMHAEMKIGDSVLMLGEACEGFDPMPMSLYLYVTDSDALYRAALGAGGESVQEPTDQFWGDRVGTITDFAGNKWWIATHVEDVDSDELTRRMQAHAKAA